LSISSPLISSIQENSFAKGSPPLFYPFFLFFTRKNTNHPKMKPQKKKGKKEEFSAPSAPPFADKI